MWEEGGENDIEGRVGRLVRSTQGGGEGRGDHEREGEGTTLVLNMEGREEGMELIGNMRGR